MQRLAAMVIGSMALSACGSGDRNPMAANDQGSVSAPSMPAASAPPLVPAAAPQGPSLGDADSQNGQFRLTVTEAVRTGGVLTIKARVTLLGDQRVELELGLVVDVVDRLFRGRDIEQLEEALG